MPFAIVVSILSVTLKNAPTKKADVKLILDGELSGFELTGFQVWANPDAPDTYRVDLPARSWQAKGTTYYYSILRDLDPSRAASDALKEAIIAAYLAEVSKGKSARFVRPASHTRQPTSQPQAKPTPRLVGGGRGPRAAADLTAQLATLAATTVTADQAAAKAARAPKGPDMSAIALAAADARAADANEIGAQPATAADISPAQAAAVAGRGGVAAAPRPRRAARKAKRRITRPKDKRPARKAPRRRTAARKGGAR